MRARMSEVLFPEERLEANVARLLNCFTRAINALLREAHGKKSGDYHIDLLQKMRATDGVVTFNYDLVAERAIKKLSSIPAFGDWVYGFGKRPENAGKVPTLYKLHGSVNWVYDEDEEHFTVREGGASQEKQNDSSQLAVHVETFAVVVISHSKERAVDLV